MDIGPVRRRYTAEPAVSPVPGDVPAAHEPTAVERAPHAHAHAPTGPGEEALPSASACPDRSS